MEEADALCDRVALMHLGPIRAVGTPDELKRGARARTRRSRTSSASYTGDTLDGAREREGGLRAIRSARRTAGRVG